MADDSEAPAKKSDDVAVICGVTENRDVALVRQRGDRVEAGLARPLEEGKPIAGEVVRLEPREECPLVCDVKTELPAPQTEERTSSNRPAKVATDAYRKNWSRIFGRSKTTSAVN